jgi:hypothetical protein
LEAFKSDFAFLGCFSGRRIELFKFSGVVAEEKSHCLSVDTVTLNAIRNKMITRDGVAEFSGFNIMFLITTASLLYLINFGPHTG